jgi:hypothetical protein
VRGGAGHVGQVGAAERAGASRKGRRRCRWRLESSGSCGLVGDGWVGIRADWGRK